MQLSLIVPMYNVESYIIECLESIFAQINNNDIEIILVNDGSTDNTMMLDDCFLEKQSINLVRRVNVINQENRGLSGARNSGLRIAKGDFIYFLDSDDYISYDFFNKILPILDNKIDIIEFNAIFFQDDHKRKVFNKRVNIYKSGLNLIDDEEMRAQFYAWQDWAVWYRVYNRRFWENNIFPEGWLYEDALTVPFIYQNAKKIYSLDCELIYYRYNPNSIMNTVSAKSIPSLNYAIEKLTKHNETSYMRILNNRFTIASVGIVLNNVGIKDSFFWILRKFNRLEYTEIKLTGSKKMLLINYFPFILIPYFKIKSLGILK